MNSELSSAFARPDCLRHSSDVLEHDSTLDLMLVDVVYSIVCYGQRSLLRPIEHVGLLYLARINQLVYTHVKSDD